MGIDSALQYFVNFSVLAVFYIFSKLHAAWALLNDYAAWRAGVLVIIGYFIAWSLSKDVVILIARVSHWFKFGLANETAKLAGLLVFRLTFLTSIIIAVKSAALPATISTLSVSLLTTLLIVSVFLFANQMAHLTLRHLAKTDEAIESNSLLQPKTLPIFEYVTMILMTMTGIYSVFQVWGIELTALLASLGVAGLAIGMAAKDTLADVIAGILILTDSPFVLGDTIDFKGESGVITHIGLRNTRIKTAQNVEIIIPNSKIGASEIINKSHHLRDDLLISLPIRAAYGVDPQVIRELLTGVARNHPNVMQNETVSVALEDFNQAQTTFVLSCRVIKGQLRPATLAAMREAVYLEFLRHNIEVALPDKGDVSIKQFPYIFSSGQPREYHPYQNVRSVG